jgi:hypothetical protein
MPQCVRAYMYVCARAQHHAHTAVGCRSSVVREKISVAYLYSRICFSKVPVFVSVFIYVCMYGTSLAGSSIGRACVCMHVCEYDM